MKKFISCRCWRDLTDHHLYREGDPFPFDGRDVSADRLKALENGRNLAGLPVIRAVESPDEEAEAAKAEEPEEAKKPAKRTRKTK